MVARVLPADTTVQAMTWGDAVEAPFGPVAPGRTVAEQIAPERQQDEIRAREQAGFERGLREGRASALAELSGRAESAMSRAAVAAAELAAAAPRARAAAQDDVVRLSIAIAQRILRREVAVDPDALAGIALAALQRLNGREAHHVRTHPDDCAAVERSLLGAGAPPGIAVEADVSLERGSLIFETRHGNLDASVWTQLGEIERGLTEASRRARV